MASRNTIALMGRKPIHRTAMTDAERQRRRRARLKRERSIAKGVSKRARRDAREAAMGRQLSDATPKADRYHSATRHCYVDLFKEYAGAAFL
jgi:hypothetical protein